MRSGNFVQHLIVGRRDDLEKRSARPSAALHARWSLQKTAYLTQARKAGSLFGRQTADVSDHVTDVIKRETFERGVLVRRFRIGECCHLPNRKSAG